MTKGARSFDVVVVGAGAAGLGLGATLRDLGIENFVILDRAAVGASFLRWPRQMRFITPSFNSTQFGALDLNSVCLHTSPAYSIGVEHPTGEEYAGYLQRIAKHFDLPVETGVDVLPVATGARPKRFRVATSRGDFHARFVAWAGGVRRKDEGYRLTLEGGDVVDCAEKPILASGFVGSASLVRSLFDWRDDGFPLLTEDDESTVTKGLFLVGPLAGLLTSWPQPLAEILAGDYGFVTMGPLLLVWATPVVVLHALLMGAYKASGLLDRLTNAMNPWLHPFGMTGRELARVVMGFGCNVPAVISARSSSACARGACVSAIAFGSACSYQLGATLAVFAAAGRPDLVVPYLLCLGATTLAYARLIAPRAARSPFNVLLTEGRVFLTWPRPRAIRLEAQGVVLEFFRRALPVFFLITAAASLLHWLGALQAASAVVEPAMAVFRLPSEAALAVVLASVRKDGILLLAEPGVVASLGAVQLLTAVYLAGVLLPCLATCLTIAREQGRAFALRLVGRQAVAATGFSALLAWGGAWL